MKYITLIIAIIFSGMLMQAQRFERAPDDSVKIYFIRNSFSGAARNYRFFDGENIIGKFNGKKAYMVYECKPGEHLFSIGTDMVFFIEGNFKAGNTYIVTTKEGFGKLHLNLLNPKSTKEVKEVWKVVGKRPPVEFTKEQLKNYQYELNYFITEEMERYTELTENGENFKHNTSGKEMPEGFLTN